MIILLEHKLKEIKKFSPLSPPFLAAARNVVLYVSTFKALEQFHLAKNFSIFFSLVFAVRFSPRLQKRRRMETQST